MAPEKFLDEAMRLSPICRQVLEWEMNHALSPFRRSMVAEILPMGLRRASR
jgi:hypothetical protein